MGAMMMTAGSGPAPGPHGAASLGRSLALCLLFWVPVVLTAAHRPVDPENFALYSPLQAALNGAGCAWTESQDPAQWSKTRRPALHGGFSQSYDDQRGGGVQARMPLGPRSGWGLGAGMQRQNRGAELRMRSGLGWDLDGPTLPTLGAALTLRDRRVGRDDGLAAAGDVGLAWTPLALGVDLALALRELPLGGPWGSWRRQGAVGLAWRGKKDRLALDLTQQADWDMVGHVAVDRELQPGWSAIASLASPPQVGAPWTWALGLQHQRGDWIWSLATQQPAGGGSGTFHAGAAWNFKPVAEAASRRRPASPRSDPAPTALPSGFVVQSTQTGAGLQLSWAEQPNAQAYEVLVGLVQGATMRLAAEGRVEQSRWRGSLGLPGAVYYFKVRALNADDAPIGESQRLSLQAPGGQP